MTCPAPRRLPGLAGDARRPRVARDPPRDDARPARARSRRAGRSRGYIGFDPTGDSLHIGHLIPIFGLLRLQRHGGQAGRARRRRDRDDRRPVGPVVGAEPAGPRRRSSTTWRRSAASSSGFLDFSPGPTQAADGRTTSTGSASSIADRLPARRRQALHGPVHAGQGLGPAAAGARPLVHRVQLHDAPGARLRRRSTASTASRCRWAARTSGATSRPAWS